MSWNDTQDKTPKQWLVNVRSRQPKNPKEGLPNLSFGFFVVPMAWSELGTTRPKDKLAHDNSAH